MSLDGDDGYGSGGDHGRGGRAGRGRGNPDDQGRPTRTRLPEGEGDPYDGPRRGGRTGVTSRNLMTVVGVVVLLVAAIAFANRGGGNDGGGSGKAADKSTGAQATAPTGVKPVDGKNNGIAKGFAHTEQGAQSAAANYAVALSSDAMFRAETRHRIVAAVYAPEVVTARQGDYDQAYSGERAVKIGLKADGTAPSGLTFVSRTNPAGTKATAYKDDTATVAVWYSTLFGLAGESSKNPVSEGWYTSTFQLKWVGDDWKVTAFSQKDGPTPVGRDQAASSAKDMSDAVQGFGGFTYAR
ncbi:hypothetical protein [Streptomyces varsoviensis]|uniref:hypothetical protein n=1 Tax=Streptomyces varsoviensis TaxID=67373 RepID=UPI0004CBD088|nr:hypothetical protein [Streptomyces varsoviensis]